MKRIIISGLVLVIVVSGAAWAAYSIGHQRGHELGLQRGHELGLIDERRGDFVESFNALQKLRAGDIDGSIHKMEIVCFSDAYTVYGGSPDTRLVAETFNVDFRHYRQTYRTNSADWSVTEQNLEKMLATWK